MATYCGHSNTPAEYALKEEDALDVTDIAMHRVVYAIGWLVTQCNVVLWLVQVAPLGAGEGLDQSNIMLVWYSKV